MACHRKAEGRRRRTSEFWILDSNLYFVPIEERFDEAVAQSGAVALQPDLVHRPNRGLAKLPVRRMEDFSQVHFGGILAKQTPPISMGDWFFKKLYERSTGL